MFNRIENTILLIKKKRGNSDQITCKFEELFCTRETDNELTNYVSFCECLQNHFPSNEERPKIETMN